MLTKSKRQWIEADKAAIKKPPKYRNKRCQDSRGRWFDSKLEQENHLALEAEFNGRHTVVMRQVSLIVIDGPKPVRMVIDHVIYNHSNPGPEFYDTKGREPTRAWINKARALYERYGIRVVALGKGLKAIDY